MYFLIDIYSLLWLLNSFVRGGGQHNSLLLERYLTAIRDVSREVRGLIPDSTYPQWYTRLPVVHLIHGSYQWFTWYYNQSQVINLVLLCYSECSTANPFDDFHKFLTYLLNMKIHMRGSDWKYPGSHWRWYQTYCYKVGLPLIRTNW